MLPFRYVMQSPIANKKIAPLYGILVILAFFVYWPAHLYEFINFDDPIYIINNPAIQNGLNWQSVKWAFSSFYAGNWHPLTWLSHTLDWQVYGNFAGGHHLTNLFFHIANSLLLFTFLIRATSAILPSFICAILFAIHPLHVESVVWISERKDVLCTFFVLLAFLAYLKWIKSQNKTPFILTHLLLIAALLAKPMAVTFPFLLLIIDFWPLKRFSSLTVSENIFTIFIKLLKEKSLLIALCIFSAIITFYAQQAAGAVKTIHAISIASRIINALSSYVQYIIKLIWPANLAIFYPFQHNNSLWLAIMSGVSILYFLISLKKLKNKFPFVISGFLWFLISLIPVIGLIQIGNQAYADRYMYIPAIGIYIIPAWSIEILSNKRLKKFITIALFFLLALLTIISRRQVANWSDSISIFQHALTVTKSNDTAHTYLANAYRDKGNLRLAEKHYKDALAINHKSIEALINLGVLITSSSPKAAKRIFRQVITLYPQNPEGHNNLANILKQENKLAQAISHYKIAIQLAPNYKNALFNLASTYDSIGNFDQAVKFYKQCLKQNADFAEAYNGLGIVLAKKGQIHAAIAQFNKALSIKPDNKSAQQNLIKAREVNSVYIHDE